MLVLVWQMNDLVNLLNDLVNNKNMFDLNKISPAIYTLDNGVKVYGYFDNSIDLIRLEFLFEAGSIHFENPLVAQACVSMLTKGTASKTGEQVAEAFDYYGAYIDKLSDKDLTSFTVHGLSRNLEALVELCDEIFSTSIFSQNELDIYCQKIYQKFLISKQKVTDVSRRELLKNVFGSENPYGRSATDDDFKNVHREDLLKFFNERIASGPTSIVIAGGFNEDIVKMLNKYFGIKQPLAMSVSALPSAPMSNDCIFIDMPSAVQSSLRMGRVAPIPLAAAAGSAAVGSAAVGSVSEDFCSLKTLDFIFGGYFGSRLSKNIREEKGYTYGISSYIISMRGAGLWQISSEIKKGSAKKVLKEIDREKEKLCNELISDKELTLVKNCFWGDLLRAMDGVFDKADKKRFLINLSIDETHYVNLWNTVQSATPEQVRTTAQHYFVTDNFVKIIVGE
jgi:predicted Zn-dependent peptidase